MEGQGGGDRLRHWLRVLMADGSGRGRSSCWGTEVELTSGRMSG